MTYLQLFKGFYNCDFDVSLVKSACVCLDQLNHCLEAFAHVDEKDVQSNTKLSHLAREYEAVLGHAIRSL